MKTLLLVGGILLLLLGFLLLVAAVIVFLVARNKRAPAAPPFDRAQGAGHGAQGIAEGGGLLRPAPSAPRPGEAGDATVVAGKPNWGALHGVSGLVAGQTFPIPLDGFYIGRDRALAQIVVEDPSVSKKHVWIGLREGIVMAIDQSSTNGTYLNKIGTRIGQVRLSPGDTIILSDDVARFVYKA